MSSVRFDVPLVSGVPGDIPDEPGEGVQALHAGVKKLKRSINQVLQSLAVDLDELVASPAAYGFNRDNWVRNGDFASYPAGDAAPYYWTQIAGAGFVSPWTPTYGAVPAGVPGVNWIMWADAPIGQLGLRCQLPARPGGTYCLSFFYYVQGAGNSPVVDVRDSTGPTLLTSVTLANRTSWTSYPAAQQNIVWTVGDAATYSEIDFRLPVNATSTLQFFLAGVCVTEGTTPAFWKPTLRGEAASNEGANGQVLIKDSTQPTKSRYGMAGTGGSIQEEQFVPAALQTVFTLANNYKANGLKTVFVNGVELEHNIDYNLPGGSPTLTFLNNGYTLAATDFLWVIYERE